MLSLRWVHGQCHSPFTALVVVSQKRTADGSKKQTAVGISMGATAVGPISSWLLASSNNLKKELFAIAQDAQVLFAILKHPDSPWSAKIVSGCAVAYLLSPIQLIPSFIPVIGQLDDWVVLRLAMKCVRRLLPENVVAECNQKARAWRAEQNKALSQVLQRLRKWRHLRHERACSSGINQQASLTTTYNASSTKSTCH
jgi:uncharacterized membrane protein YkvA (DUF1232 family)